MWIFGCAFESTSNWLDHAIELWTMSQHCSNWREPPFISHVNMFLSRHHVMLTIGLSYLFNCLSCVLLCRFNAKLKDWPSRLCWTLWVRILQRCCLSHYRGLWAHEQVWETAWGPWQSSWMASNLGGQKKRLQCTSETQPSSFLIATNIVIRNFYIAKILHGEYQFMS